MPALNDIQALSCAIENTLVERNLRGMAQVQHALTPGYIARAAQHLHTAQGQILIGTGFPVIGTFETDGPVGALALYSALQSLGKEPVLVCGNPLYSKLKNEFNCLELAINNQSSTEQLANDYFANNKVGAVVSIERPGINAQGQYTNMRGEDISHGCAYFEPFLNASSCPTIAIGDGGNEIGMGNIRHALKELNIVPSVSTCDELIIADVSNWGAYGLIAFLALWHKTDLLNTIDCHDLLAYLSRHGSVDGVTRRNELTEDSLEPFHGQAVITKLRQLSGFMPAENEEKQ